MIVGVLVVMVVVVVVIVVVVVVAGRVSSVFAIYYIRACQGVWLLKGLQVSQDSRSLID